MDIRTFYTKYRLDYVAYLVFIFALDVIALTYSHTYFFLIPTTIVWVHMLWLAIKGLKKKQVGTEFFLVFATIAAVIGNQINAIIVVLLIMLIARYAELLIEQHTSNAIEKLIHLIPSDVIVLVDGHEQTMALNQVVVGMHVVVKTGARVPADGLVVSGSAAINEAMLTGESMPKEKTVTDAVFAGTFVERGSIVFEVERIHKETLFSKMTALFSQAEQKKAHITIITEKISLILVPLILLLIIAVWLITGDLTIVITLLIFGSPLELSLVTPLTVLAGSVAAFRQGVLVRGGRALEQLAQIDTIIFDKTGTLTLGEPTVVDVQAFDAQYTPSDILKIAGIAELRSDHVVAKAILKKAHELAIEIPQPDEYNSLPGHGVEIVYQHMRYFLGNQHYVQAPEHGASRMPENFAGVEHGYSNFYVACAGSVIGRISVMDTLRSDAQETVQRLRDSGVKQLILLSGDRQEITEHIAKQLGINQAHGEAFPDDKLKLLDSLQQSGHIVAMIGDGINDVAALKQANVGIAMGAMGMEPAIEAADIVLMTNQLRMIVFIRAVSQKVFRVIRQDLVWGFLVLHVLGFSLTMLRLVSPVQAAFFHAISDVLILLNAARLIGLNPKNIEK